MHFISLLLISASIMASEAASADDIRKAVEAAIWRSEHVTNVPDNMISVPNSVAHPDPEIGAAGREKMTDAARLVYKAVGKGMEHIGPHLGIADKNALTKWSVAIASIPDLYVAQGRYESKKLRVNLRRAGLPEELGDAILERAGHMADAGIVVTSDPELLLQTLFDVYRPEAPRNHE